jgi:hypothetical protein
VTAERDSIGRLVEMLMERDTLDAEEIAAALRGILLGGLDSR